MKFKSMDNIGLGLMQSCTNSLCRNSIYNLEKELKPNQLKLNILNAYWL